MVCHAYSLPYLLTLALLTRIPKNPFVKNNIAIRVRKTCLTTNNIIVPYFLSTGNMTIDSLPIGQPKGHASLVISSFNIQKRRIVLFW